MNEELIKAQDIVLGRINQICGRFGLNNIMAQLYTTLYLSDQPLSLNDMVERLKTSKGTVSINIRALERYGVARQVWIKGSRRDYYEAEKDISKVIMERIKSMAQHHLSEVDDMINSAYQTVNSVNSCDRQEKDEIKAFKQKLDDMRNIHRKAQSLFRLFNSSILNNILNIKTKKNNKKEALVT